MLGLLVPAPVIVSNTCVHNHLILLLMLQDQHLRIFTLHLIEEMQCMH
jgi:hypothetical protein